MLKYVNTFLIKKMFFKNSVDNKQHNLIEEENYLYYQLYVLVFFSACYTFLYFKLG